jgi:hypothetical protein
MFLFSFKLKNRRKKKREEVREDFVTEAGMIRRVDFPEVFWSALGTALLTFGFAFFRQITEAFLNNILNKGGNVSGIPFVEQRPSPQAPRPSLWQAPSPAQEQRSGGIDLSEFR